MPEQDRHRLEQIAEQLHDHAAVYVHELRELAARYPHIPTIWNYLMCALYETGQNERAREVVRQTYERFPEYLFGLSSYICMLLKQDKIDEARQILESGPAGPAADACNNVPGPNTVSQQ